MNDAFLIGFLSYEAVAILLVTCLVMSAGKYTIFKNHKIALPFTIGYAIVTIIFSTLVVVFEINTIRLLLLFAHIIISLISSILSLCEINENEED